jgi:hypothetical protein
VKARRITCVRGSFFVEPTNFWAVCSFMSEPIPWLIENATQIAFDFLERSGDLRDPGEASRFLLRTIDLMVLNGEHRKLMLANRAIEAYHSRCRFQVVVA